MPDPTDYYVTVVPDVEDPSASRSFTYTTTTTSPPREEIIDHMLQTKIINPTTFRKYWRIERVSDSLPATELSTNERIARLKEKLPRDTSMGSMTSALTPQREVREVTIITEDEQTESCEFYPSDSTYDAFKQEQLAAEIKCNHLGDCKIPYLQNVFIEAVADTHPTFVDEFDANSLADHDQLFELLADCKQEALSRYKDNYITSGSHR